MSDNLIGYMYVGKRPCGRVSCMAWDDADYKKSTAKFVAQAIKDGLAVERIARHEGEPMPEMMCSECRGVPCKTTEAAS